MDAARVFEIVNLSVLPGWLLLILAPRWRFTMPLAGVTLPLLLAVTYATILGRHWGEGEGGFGSLAEVASLFSNNWVLLGGWIHYLAFDLFIGSWEVRDAHKHQLPHLAVVPCLLLTFLFGPGGLLLYFGLRYALRRQLSAL
jgi:hypothetical protein